MNKELEKTINELYSNYASMVLTRSLVLKLYGVEIEREAKDLDIIFTDWREYRNYIDRYHAQEGEIEYDWLEESNYHLATINNITVDSWYAENNLTINRMHIGEYNAKVCTVEKIKKAKQDLIAYYGNTKDLRKMVEKHQNDIILIDNYLSNE